MRRPAIRYHGGKFRIAPWIISLMPPHDVYVEPFGGGANVLLAKPRTHSEVYNDLDANVVNVFRVLRDPATAAELRRRCELTPFARAEFEFSYETAVDDVDRAHKMLIRSFMGFGGDAATRTCRTGFRVALSTQHIMPSSSWATWPSEIPTFVERLRGVTIENRPALELIDRLDGPATLFYLDPPYVHSTRSSLAGRSKRTHGYAHEMTDEDHVALAEAAHAALGMVMISGYRCDLYERLYGNWRSIDRSTIAEGAAKRTETVWFSPNCAGGQVTDQLFDRRLHG